VRPFRRTSGFTPAALLSLVIGGGAHTAIFSVSGAPLARLPGFAGQSIGLRLSFISAVATERRVAYPRRVI